MDPKDDHALTGAGWTITAHAVTRGVTFAASVVLARLLNPEDFGVVAVATLLVVGVGTVAGLGVPGFVVVAERDPRLFRTALTLCLLAGSIGAAVIIIASGALADLFDSGRLEAVLVVLSVTLVIGGATTFYEALFQREQRFRSLWVTQLARALTYTTVAIAAAAAGAGIWSLVAGQVAASAAYGAALLLNAPYGVVPGFSATRARQVVTSGRPFLTQTVMTTVQHNVDVAAAAYVDGARAAGLYSMSWAVASVPYSAFTEPVATAAFPAVARSHRRAGRTSALGLDLLAMLGLFACPAGIIVSATADPLVTTLLGAKWESATGALAILGLWVAVVQVEAALGWFLNATGRAHTNAVISAAVTVPLVPALLVGAHLAGIEGVAWVMVGSAVVAGVAMMAAVRDTVDLSLARQLTTLQPVAVGCAVAWVLARFAVGAADGLPAPIALLLAAAVGCVAYVAVVRLAWPAAWSHGVTFLRQIVAELRRGSVTHVP